MTVYKRKGSSIYQYEFEYQGERYRGTTHCRTKREAGEYERKVRSEISNQVLFGKIPEMTLGEAIDKYWDTYIVPTKKPAAAESYLSAYSLLRNELGADTQISSLTYKGLNAYKDGLLSGEIRGRKLKPGTIKRQFNNLRAILNKAHNDWGTLAIAPKVPRLEVDDMRNRWLTLDEEKKLMVVSPPHIQNFITFCIETGAGMKTEHASNWLNFLKWSV